MFSSFFPTPGSTNLFRVLYTVEIIKKKTCVLLRRVLLRVLSPQSDPRLTARPSGPQTSHFIHLSRLTDFLSFFLYADFSSPVLVESVGSGRTFPVRIEGPNMSCPFTSEGAKNVDFETSHFQNINHLHLSLLFRHSIFSCLFFSVCFYQ